MIEVPHYGLHWVEGGIPLLVQRGRVDHVLDVPMMFDVKVAQTKRHTFRCPHDIDLSQAVDHDLPDDPLIEAMLPLPKKDSDKTLYVEDTSENKLLVNALLKLSSTVPASSTIVPMWMYKPEVYATLLGLTNLQPLVVFGYRTDLQGLLLRLLETASFSPRRLIVIGPSWAILRQGVDRIKPDVTVDDIEHLPLAQIGAWKLAQHMRSPMETT